MQDIIATFVFLVTIFVSIALIFLWIRQTKKEVLHRLCVNIDHMKTLRKCAQHQGDTKLAGMRLRRAIEMQLQVENIVKTYMLKEEWNQLLRF